MSSKYHWTQELTNPQDRFRLFQHHLQPHVRVQLLSHKPTNPYSVLGSETSETSKTSEGSEGSDRPINLNSFDPLLR